MLGDDVNGIDGGGDFSCSLNLCVCMMILIFLSPGLCISNASGRICGSALCVVFLFREEGGGIMELGLRLALG